MNVLLIVVDSLRAASCVRQGGAAEPTTPFLDQLAGQTVEFRRAYATECWTLPTHCSMFTGLLPSQHDAHFQTMAYARTTPTIAELLARGGYRTELVTRNFVFDGTIPGIARGFQRWTQPLSAAGSWHPFALFLALAKPRFRRHVKATGFFHPRHRDNRHFLQTFARALMPADELALEDVLERMTAHRRRRQRFFIFANLYDVHAPYPPERHTILRSFRSPRGCLENLMFPPVMARLGSHRYLRADFRLSSRSCQMLRDRYHRAIELMDAKLADFWAVAEQRNLLEDTLVILTSDHGEGFGEHGLFLHDASLYDTHLHVPLWVHHPDREAAVIDDVVSTRYLYGLMRNVGLGRGLGDTLLDSGYRASQPVALAEHFHYPHVPGARPRYREDIAAAIVSTRKIIVRPSVVEMYDLARDPTERAPTPTTVEAFTAGCARDGLPRLAIDEARAHLDRWHTQGRREAAAAA